ncbi:hypothetical protein [Massilia sp. PWRC2]|uniref:hypothetical protein n=1 Tax=Massilia sp. PWRC2 TaxID=2804626 RepID=UPI003CF270E0
MGIDPVSMALIGAAIGGGASMYSAHQQKSAADDALNAQKESAAKAEANRPQASKAPMVQGVQAGQAGAGQAGGAPGVAQTFLTGASGVDPATLNLGRSTLLGG